MTKVEIEKLGDDYEVCYCMGTTLGEIIEAIKSGATTMEALKDRTEAGTLCGLCESCDIDEDEDREVHLDEIIAAYAQGS
ncbi:(2Fe-2S)-binding protein [Sulfurovum sp. zt1-1]|uniref:(2Fe-2S)-binding protein n=1 Tax=Sulfurovum zhangzhouensis TaxID=3019067 RepID=A0ABT7QY24_9BACT|nr:(2Fe-2S)-binding protein [Sulfurovum zhangzhouensis]MDM5271739.1 (2Fe-2S)-binding protein [Sulfurovum zhangzhouensis]